MLQPFGQTTGRNSNQKRINFNLLKPEEFFGLLLIFTMTRKFYILLISLLVVCTACQKGKEIDTYHPLVTLSLTNFNFDWDLFVDGIKMQQKDMVFKLIEKRAASITIKDKITGTEILTETIDITPEKASAYAIIKLAETYKILTRDAETAAEGKFKFKLINIDKSINAGKPINLILYQVTKFDRRNKKFHLKEKGDTIRNVDSNFPDKYQEIDISDNLDYLGPIFFAKVLDQDFKPIQREGLNQYLRIELFQYVFDKKRVLTAYFDTSTLNINRQYPLSEIYYDLGSFSTIFNQ